MERVEDVYEAALGTSALGESTRPGMGSPIVRLGGVAMREEIGDDVGAARASS